MSSSFSWLERCSERALILSIVTQKNPNKPLFCLCTYFSFIYTGVSMVELTRFRVRLLVTYKPFSLFILETAGSTGTYSGTSAKFKSLRNSSTLFSPLSSVPLTNTFRKLRSYVTRKSYVITSTLGVPF